ncbi:nucleoid-associated protein [Serratia nevei]|uniref:nucleoid-associated protein n=1 Tax=Serratia nevei TaxID=2703794 RepID=UPI003FA76B56
MESKTVKCVGCGRENDLADGACECGYDESLEQEEIVYKPHNAITARLDIVPGVAGNEFKATTGEIWGLDAEDVKSFILQAERKFKLKRKNHGVITKNELPNSTASLLKKYINGKSDFKSFVSLFMQNVKIQAGLNARKPAGGSIVIIHYHTDNEVESVGRLFVIMVDNNSVFNFDENLVPKKLPSIDMDALRQAVLVDLTLFDVSYPSNDSEPYLQFITGKSNSNFFKKAIGCEEDLNNNRSVEQAEKAVKEFGVHMNLAPIDKVRVLDAVKQLMHEKAKSKTNNKVTLDDIASSIDKALSDDSNAKGKFAQFALLGEYKIDEFFEPSRNSEKKFGKVSLSDDDKDYTCSISVKAIGIDNDPKAKALYKKDEGILVIKLSDHDIEKMNDIFSG